MVSHFRNRTTAIMAERFRFLPMTASQDQGPDRSRRHGWFQVRVSVGSRWKTRSWVVAKDG